MGYKRGEWDISGENGIYAEIRVKAALRIIFGTQPSLHAGLCNVRAGGLEPPRLSAPDPKSGAATITPRARHTLQSYSIFAIRTIPRAGVISLRA